MSGSCGHKYVSGQQIITSLGIAGEHEISADLIQKDGWHGRDAVGAIIAQLPQGVVETAPPMAIQKHLLFILDLEQIGAI